jgi:hypothetical protein
MNDCIVDLPPEYCQYHDEGCDFAESCLNCPLPVCVYDEPGGKRRLKNRRRAAEIASFFNREGKNTGEVAQILGVSRRTVQRALKMTFGDKKGCRPDLNKESTTCETFHPHPNLLPSREKRLKEGVKN